MHNKSFIAGCVYAFLAVGLGAFGAHALKERLSADMMAVYHTGIQYQMFHALALLVVAFAYAYAGDSNKIRWAGRLFQLGIVLFSGSLYVLAISGLKWFGAITPLGGVSFLAGWMMLALSLRKR